MSTGFARARENPSHGQSPSFAPSAFGRADSASRPVGGSEHNVVDIDQWKRRELRVRGASADKTLTKPCWTGCRNLNMAAERMKTHYAA